MTYTVVYWVIIKQYIWKVTVSNNFKFTVNFDESRLYLLPGPWFLGFIYLCYSCFINHNPLPCLYYSDNYSLYLITTSSLVYGLLLETHSLPLCYALFALLSFWSLITNLKWLLLNFNLLIILKVISNLKVPLTCPCIAQRKKKKNKRKKEEAYITKSKEEAHIYCIVRVGCTKMKYQEFQRRRYPQATDLL